jgi:hypothetical protein
MRIGYRQFGRGAALVERGDAATLVDGGIERAGACGFGLIVGEDRRILSPMNLSTCPPCASTA